MLITIVQVSEQPYSHSWTYYICMQHSWTHLLLLRTMLLCTQNLCLWLADGCWAQIFCAV